jgi:hypothetical protein
MLLFRSEEHVETWCWSRSLPVGGTLSLGQASELAWIWFRDRLEPSWKRKSVEEAESVFGSLGLKGDFWKLRP